MKNYIFPTIHNFLDTVTFNMDIPTESKYRAKVMNIYNKLTPEEQCTLNMFLKDLADMLEDDYEVSY